MSILGTFDWHTKPKLGAGLHGSWSPASAIRQLPSTHRSTRPSQHVARAFAIAGPTVWNSLPDSLRDPAVGPDQFQRDLKTHLFE